ncbi:Flagellin protein FlaA (plasmid) [Rhodovastum atsumiense]|uniref:flagellin N-terminal helical domain-containing protein n=1 Tax=Rhodovastum atsumiense TaxID=504468 RepID=UPI0020240453|nr:flagellin [Rhodovastum atsumiense]CAH2605612.1 Flagellin protein FlaA [Rhodovastum atsumiense]
MVNSILTNFGSLVALQNLQATQKNLLDTQNRISTGLKVGTSKDDAATWAISTQMKGSIANLQQVSSNLSQTDSVIGTAVSATSSIADLVSQIRAKVTASKAPGTDVYKVQNDIGQLVAQIQSTVDAASFNGVNLLNSKDTQKFVSSVVTDGSGNSTPAYISVDGVNLNTSSTGSLTGLGNLSVVSRSDQMFNASGQTAAVTAEQNAYATRQVGYVYTAPGAAGTQTFAVTYVDSTGKSQTTNFNITVANADTASTTASNLNSNTEFAKLFHASVDSAGNLAFSMATRTTAGSVTSVANSTMLAAAAVATRETTLSFQDSVPLTTSDSFTFKFQQGAHAGTVSSQSTTIKLQISNEATGRILSSSTATDASNATQLSYTIALNVNSVSGDGITGATIASAISTALQSTDWTSADGTTTVASGNYFGTAGAATKLGITSSAIAANGAGNNTLTIATADATDDLQITSATTDYANLLTQVDTAASTVTTASATFGSAQKRVETQKTFVDSLVANLQAGVGNLVDADMSTESARLTALQVQQQLGTQALSIANQAPQNILSLFK